MKRTKKPHRNGAGVPRRPASSPPHSPATEGAQAVLAAPSTNERNLRYRLFDAAENKRVEEVVKLLDQGADVNWISRNSATLVMVAAASGQIDLVRLLLQRGAVIQTEHGGDALVSAAASGSCELVALLLETGATIATEGQVGNTALAEAARRGHTPVVQLLLERGASVLDGMSPSGNALTWATKKGFKDIADLLLTSLETAPAEDLLRLARFEHSVGNSRLAAKLQRMAGMGGMVAVPARISDRTPIITYQMPIIDKPQLLIDEDASEMDQMETRLENLLRLGQEQKRKRNYQEAERLYKEGVALAPWHLNGYFALGKLYYLMGEREKSLQYYSAATHLHLGLGDAQSMHEDLQQIRKMLRSTHSPDLLEPMQALHPHADLLLLDNNTPRHLGHSLVDLEQGKQLSRELASAARAYKQSISGSAFAQTDSDLEMSFYHTAGVSYLVENIQWSKVGRVPPHEVSALYASQNIDGSRAKAANVELTFAMRVLARTLNLIPPQSSIPYSDLMREVGDVLQSLSDQERCRFGPLLDQSARTATEVLSGSFYASFGSTLLDTLNKFETFQPLMGRRWRDTVGSVQTPFSDLWFKLHDLAQGRSLQTPMLGWIIAVLDTREIRLLRNSLVHKSYSWQRGGTGSRLVLTKDDATTVKLELTAETCEAFHIVMGSCALVIDHFPLGRTAS